MVTYRNLKSLDPLTFSASLHTSPLSDISFLSCPDEILSVYNDSILHTLDALAPVKQRLLPSSRSSPWFTIELRAMKATGRCLERLFRKTGFYGIFCADHMSRYRDALNKACSYLNNMVSHTEINIAGS